MPSPITRSCSLPQIAKPKSSFPSNRSTSSSSYVSPPLKFQSKQRKNATSCDLTKENLSEHNRLQQLADAKKINKASPYYKGLTDSQLYLKSLRNGGDISPSRESRITRVSKTSTLSTIFVKVQGIAFCFKGKRELIDDEVDIPEELPPPPPSPGMPSSVAMNSGVSVSLEKNEIGNFAVLEENIPSGKEAGAVEWKPLRERYLMGPLTEDCDTIVQEMQKESSTVERFTWAKKYRPKRLKDFICNRDKAELLLNLNIIAAGTDTTTIALTWAVSLLLNHPNTLKKAQDELDIHVGQDRRVDESDIKNLVYLDAIIKETLRLYPPAPVNATHEAIEDCHVSGFYVPAGTQIILNTWKIQRDPRMWLDPTEFRPERFLTSHVHLDFRGQQFEYIPFGSGRRSCPGISMALQMMQLTLAHLIHGFDMATPTGEPVDMSEGLGLTMPKTTPLEVLLTPRLPLKLYEQ